MTYKRMACPVLAVALVIAVGAVFFLGDWDPERTRREEFVRWCNEEGGGGMITSRDYCEALYARSQAGRAGGNSR